MSDKEKIKSQYIIIDNLSYPADMKLFSKRKLPVSGYKS